MHIECRVPFKYDPLDRELVVKLTIDGRPFVTRIADDALLTIFDIEGPDDVVSLLELCNQMRKEILDAIMIELDEQGGDLRGMKVLRINANAIVYE